ncbi:MAG: hypothetical protein BME93_05495 [Methanosarcinales archaeon Met12]|nr:MAG: hypothetical protein BME93_05495 [Methanosarcinales archaeon Met12]
MTFEAKTLKIGSSIGVLIPKEVVEGDKIVVGERIELAIVSRRRKNAIERTFAIAKGAKGFFRLDHLDREL